MSTLVPALPTRSGGLPMPNRRELLAGSLLLAVTGASEWLKPVRMFAPLTPDELADAIPTTVGGYRFATSSGLILPPRDELSEKLYDQVLTRVYLAPGKPAIMALFAYGSVQNLSLELHRPEECYPPQGFAIIEPQPLALMVGGHAIAATVLTARRPDGYVEQVAFWSRIGTRFPPDRAAQSMLVARENFAGRMPDGLLVRLSVPSPDRAQAIAMVRDFVRDLDRGLAPLGRRIMFGASSGAGPAS